MRTNGSVVCWGENTNGQATIPVTSFVVTAPASAMWDATFTFTATAVDPFGTTVTGYNGTAHFSSSDGAATLPADHPFNAADKGSHQFTATLRTTGIQTLTVSDAAKPTLTGSAHINVYLLKPKL